ncbi:hypothetical protein Syun_020770 [Stephania yunnanensis]|uniref:Uncharacterized protein n=1 Tax=Stephania yunnanensis TaxID=152371 RepID=A0AAP0IF85_9MAGN
MEIHAEIILRLLASSRGGSIPVMEIKMMKFKFLNYRDRKSQVHLTLTRESKSLKIYVYYFHVIKFNFLVVNCLYILFWALE